MPRGKGGRGRKKERFGKKRRRKVKRRNKKYNRALKSWKKDFPDYFDFDPEKYPFYFAKNKNKKIDK